jgi:hypothetical protein
MARDCLSRALKIQRKRNASLRKEIDNLQARISTEAVPVTNQLHSSLKQVLGDEILQEPLIKLFWEEQCKNFKRSSSGQR